MSKKSVVLVSIVIFLPLVGYGMYLFTEQVSVSRSAVGGGNEIQKGLVDSDDVVIEQDLAIANSLDSTSTVISTTSLKATEVHKFTAPNTWATVSSEQGFSFSYPYKEVGMMWGDDGLFQANIFFPASVITLDINTKENLSDDIHNIGLYTGISILVIENNLSGVDFKSWVQTYLKNKNNHFGKDEVVLSEKISPRNFAGVEGYQVIQSIEGSKRQGGPHYTRKETFVSKGKFIYRISTLAASSDTTFPRSALAGKKYLQHVDEFAQKILESFVFNNSSKTTLNFPKITPPKLSEKNASIQEKLLATLSVEPFFDTSKKYELSSNVCAINTTNIVDSNNGVYLSVDIDNASIHAYDTGGGHTGTLPKIPGMDDGGAPIEERIYEVTYDRFGSSEMLSIQKNIEGRIELVGKEYGWANFTISGDGNSCEIVNMSIPVTPYSVGTLKMDKLGNIGPITYDINGDGKQDFIISLVHPLLQEKNTLITSIMDNMKSSQ